MNGFSAALLGYECDSGLEGRGPEPGIERRHVRQDRLRQDRPVESNKDTMKHATIPFLSPVGSPGALLGAWPKSLHPFVLSMSKDERQAQIMRAHGSTSSP